MCDKERGGVESKLVLGTGKIGEPVAAEKERGQMPVNDETTVKAFIWELPEGKGRGECC